MGSNKHSISTTQLTLSGIDEIISSGKSLELSTDSKKKIIKCREYLDKKLSGTKEAIYGINTGFGSLYNKSISNNDLEQLQENLVRSHACGVGEEVPKDIVRLMLLLKIQSLSYGYSGVQLETVNRLIDFYNHEIYPVVYTQGSLGASGDLAPLAHLSLPLMGEGEVNYKGKKQNASSVLKQLGWKPLKFKSKEALALLNGTQFMSAYGVFNLLKSRTLSAYADVIASVSLDGYDGRIDAFDELIHSVRPHAGQVAVAKNICSILKGSKIIAQKKQHVQDPYSFRCVPQVHGASRDAIEYAEKVITTEINSVSDNPTIFPEEGKIISGGNFHGQPLALALDFLSIAVAELGSISERRTYLLISGQRGLPQFLVANPGLNSGFMIPQYTAASIVSQNKQLCTPASVDSIISSNGQEDHVSMGANAAVKCKQVIDNLEKILAIELFTAMQAIEFRKPLKSSPKIEKLKSSYRKTVSFIEKDKVMFTEIEKTMAFIRNYFF